MQELIRPDGSVIAYEVIGSGDPVLLLAPRSISSTADQWGEYFLDPRLLADEFTVITMDQRYAGASRAALSPFSHDDAFGDQLAVLDVLGIDSASVIGADLYCASALKLACEAPARTHASILIEPMGLDDSNSMDAYYSIFNDSIRTARADGLEGIIAAAENNPIFANNPEAGPWCHRLHDQPGFATALRSLRRENYITLLVDFRDGVFPWDKRYFSVNELAISRTTTPFLIAPGNDDLHPAGLATRIKQDAENATIFSSGRENSEKLLTEIRKFLHQHTQACSIRPSN